MSLWNSTFDASTDWSAYAFASMFYSAVNERLTALGLTTVTAPALGTDGQSASFWSTLQSKAELAATGFTRVYDGMPAVTDQTDGHQETLFPLPSNYTLATWRSTAGMGSGGYRRKRPREIASLSATVDTQGNARATGQVAWLTSSTAPGPYTFDGTAWTPAPTASPDVLDSAAGTLAAGVAVAGDYMGPWILTELRDGLNLLDMKGLTGSSFLGGPSTYAQGGSFDPSNPITSWADAQASAEGWWSTTPAHGASDEGNGVYSEGIYSTNSPPFPNTYGAGLKRDKWSFTLSDSGTASKRYELYAVPVRIPLLSTDGGAGTINPNIKYTFYNEDGWPRATYSRAYTGTYGTATSASVTSPSGTGKPAWCDSPDATLRGQYKGCGFYWYGAIRYNFAYNIET